MSFHRILGVSGWRPAHYLVVAFCCVALLVPLGGETLFAVTALIGCYKLIVPSQRKQVFDQIQIDKQDLLWTGLAVASILLIKLVSLGWTINFKASWRDVGTHIHFALFIPVVAALVSLKQKAQAENAAKAGCILAGLFGGIWAIAHVVKSGASVTPVLFEAGAQNAIVLGGFACILTVWLFLWFVKQPEAWTAAALTGAIIMMLATGRRTPVLSLIAVAVIVGAMHLWRSRNLIKKQIAIKQYWFLAVACLVVLFIATASSWQLALVEIQNYAQTRNPSTSVGARLELYTVAVKAFQAAPWLGHGAGTTFELVQNYSDQAKNVFWTGHMHNQYFQWLTESGTSGMAIICAALGWIWHTLTSSKKTKDAGSNTWAWPASLLIVIAVWALFSAVFKQGLVNSYFVFMLALLWLWTHSAPHATQLPGNLPGDLPSGPPAVND